jgi:hypothetical protein
LGQDDGLVYVLGRDGRVVNVIDVGTDVTAFATT